jgi:hypothetical protein
MTAMTGHSIDAAPEAVPKSLKIVGAGGMAAILLLGLVLVGVIPLPHTEFESCAGCPPCPTCSPPPIGLGTPLASTCTSNETFAATGCSPGEYVYRIAIEYSSLTFGGVRFNIETAAGTVYVATTGEAGFSMLYLGGQVAAQYSARGGVMSMTSDWKYTYPTVTNDSTPLNGDLFTILIDMGTMNPHGQGYVFVPVPPGAYTGTANVTLP